MEIIVDVKSIKSFFVENSQELKDSLMLIAKDADLASEIYMTSVNEMPYFVVDIDGICKYESNTISWADAEKTYRDILALYVSEECVDGDVDEGDDDNVDDDAFNDEYLTEDDMARLDDIDGAVEDLLRVLLEKYPEKVGITQDDKDELVFEIERILFDTYGLSVRHPTIIDDDSTGLGVVIQYPYCEVDDDEFATDDSDEDTEDER